MISAPTFSVSGKSLEAISLPAKIFAVKASPALLAQAVRVYLGNQRQASAQTKTRGMVEGSTRKIWRQKGTGRARHGSIRAPIFVGGGIAHGPTGSQNYSGKLPAKMRRLALLGALSAKAAAKQVSVVTGVDKSNGKTNQAAWLAAGKTALVITLPQLEKFNRSVRNLDQVDAVTADKLNTYQVLSHQQVILAKPALEALVKTYAA